MLLMLVEEVEGWWSSSNEGSERKRAKAEKMVSM